MCLVTCLTRDCEVWLQHWSVTSLWCWCWYVTQRARHCSASADRTTSSLMLTLMTYSRQALTTIWRHRCLARNTRHCSTTLWTDSSYRLVSITTFQATRLPIGTVSRAMFFSYYSSVQSFFSKSKQVQVKSLLSRMNEMDRQRRR